MKKSIIMIVTMLALSGLCGCSLDDTDATTSSGTILSTRQDNIDTYSVSGNPTFLPITYQHVNDGSMNGIAIVEFVHTSDGTVWNSTEKYNNGLTTTFTQEFGPDGKPVLYDGDLNTLKAKYGVE